MFRCENEDVVREFLRHAPEFALDPCRCPLTGRETPGCVQLWPWDGDCDAMFVARMRRR